MGELTGLLHLFNYLEHGKKKCIRMRYGQKNATTSIQFSNVLLILEVGGCS
jgi:hypothetical protein